MCRINTHCALRIIVCLCTLPLPSTHTYGSVTTDYKLYLLEIIQPITQFNGLSHDCTDLRLWCYTGRYEYFTKEEVLNV